MNPREKTASEPHLEDLDPDPPRIHEYGDETPMWEDESHLDDVIRMKVANVLRLERAGRKADVEVRVADAVVTLEGEVQSERRQQVLVATVGAVPGVRDVVDRMTLTVTPEEAEASARSTRAWKRSATFAIGSFVVLLAVVLFLSAGTLLMPILLFVGVPVAIVLVVWAAYRIQKQRRLPSAEDVTRV